jgi:hypothetical protein
VARAKNPIKDIGETVGGWLNSAAKSTDVFLKGNQNPFIPTPARKGIGASQTVGDALSGGLVSAAQKGGDAFGKQLAINAVTGATISGAGAGVMKALRSPAVRSSVKGAIGSASEYLPTTRKNMLNAVDAERKIAKLAFQKEADIMTRRWTTEMSGMKRMLEGSQQALAKSELRKRTYRSGMMDLYEETPAYTEMIDQNDISQMTRGAINKEIIRNAQLQDLSDDILGTGRPAEKMAEKYLRAKGEIVKESLKYLTPEQKKKALESQLGKSILRRQGPK